MNMKKLPIKDRELRIDIDEFVWVCDWLNESWIRTTTWSANALYEAYPKRYTHWMHDSELRIPDLDE